MNRREIKSIIGKVEKSRLKIRKLTEEAKTLQHECQKSLDKLANSCCPYKKGQLFKKRGAAVWAKMTGHSATQMKYGKIDEKYISAPFQVDCLRCNVKGETQKDKFIFISGHEIGTEWDLV